MNTRSPLVVGIAVLAGVALLAIAAVYLAEPARSLPSFFPGYETGSAHHHVKHGLAALMVGLTVLVFAWFQTGSKRQPA